MQTFSYLQRKIDDQDYLTLSLIWLAFFVWESISNIYPYMPPMFGFLVTSGLIVKRKQYVIGIFAFLLIFETDHSYFLFSTWLYFYLHTRYIMPLIGAFVDCKNCLLALSVVLAYLLYYTLLFCIGAIFLEHAHFYNLYPVFVYIVIETLLVLGTNDVKR